MCDLEAFCAAFYHVYKIYGQHPVNYECLIKPRNGCRVAEFKNYKLKEPKDVALLAVLQEDDQQIIWISSFTNCCQCIYDMYGRKVKKHAEDFLLEDATSNKKNSLGSVLKGLKRSDTKSRALKLYVTYQPCHFSVANSMEKSCTETVKKLYNEHLRPKGVMLIIKPTHILKAYWNIEQNKRMSEEDKKQVRNAGEGMRILADLQIKEEGKFSVKAMAEDDWKLLKEAFGFGEEMQFEYDGSQRMKLDEFMAKELDKAKKDAQEKKVLKGASAENKDDGEDDSKEDAPKKTLQKGRMKVKNVVKEARVEDKDESKDDKEEEHTCTQKGKEKNKRVAKKKDQGDKM